MCVLVVEQFTLVQIPNSHSLGLKIVNSLTREMEIAFSGSPEQSSQSLTRSLKVFISQMQ